MKSPATITEGEQSNFLATSILNSARRDSKYLTCAIFTSAHSGSLQQIIDNYGGKNLSNIFILSEKQTNLPVYMSVRDNNIVKCRIL